MSNLWLDDGQQQDAWYAQGQGASQPQPNMSWGQFDYSQQQQQDANQQYTSNQSYYQQQNPYAQSQNFYGGQMFVPSAGVGGAGGGDGEDYENEPPLLEELGINFSHIKEKTFAVLNPTSSASPEVIEDQDLAGPLVFCLLFGFALLLHGKMTFGYIYGIGGLGCVGMYALMNLMAGSGKDDLIHMHSFCVGLLFTSDGASQPGNGSVVLQDMNLKVDTTPEAWLVTPTPGYVLKFNEVDMKLVFGESEPHKCFLNICHCEELPPPTDDIDEDELAARIDKGDVGYRIPVSIGELDSVVDNKNVNQPKIDVLVNSVFYEKRLAPPAANFFRHFFCMVVCDAIEDKHHLKLDPNKCVKLKNRTVMGCIEPMKIAKRPVAPVIQEIASIDPEPEPRIPVCYFLCLLRLRINRDRVVLLADNSRSIYDFCVPFYMDSTNVRHKFLPDVAKLKFSVPIYYP
ncbi:Yip1 domain protein [Ostertagia ostertagi]